MGAKRKKRKRETKLFFIVEFWRRRREHFQKFSEFKEKGTLANLWHGFQGKVWHENREIFGPIFEAKWHENREIFSTVFEAKCGTEIEKIWEKSGIDFEVHTEFRIVSYSRTDFCRHGN